MTVAMPWLQKQAAQLRSQRGHAWLLQGAAGLGQYELALSLVHTWLCESVQADGSACGACPSCHAIAIRAHADLCVLMPEVQMIELGWPLGEKAQAEIDDKKRKPSKEIRIEAMRDAVEFSQRTSARSQGKVVLVYPAESMNAIAANALLKTLEEPVGDTRFVLATSAPAALLPTIRSRCQVHTLQRPSDAEGLAWLEQNGLSPADAGVLLRCAGGLPAQALDYAANGPGAALWRSLPQAIAQGATHGSTQELRALGPKALLDALYKLAHDLLSIQLTGKTRFFEEKSLEGLRPPLDTLRQWARDLGQHWAHVEHPYHLGLLQDAWLEEARQVVQTRTHERKPV